MKSKFTQKQKIIEVSSIVVWVVWIIAILITWNTQILSSNAKSSIVEMLIFGFIIYGILSYFTVMPEATNIITSKKYNEQNKKQIITICRTFFCSIKFIFVLEFATLSMIEIFSPKLKTAITILFYLLILIDFIIYWLLYRKIPK